MKLQSFLMHLFRAYTCQDLLAFNKVKVEFSIFALSLITNVRLSYNKLHMKLLHNGVRLIA